ncbi:MAG: trypsin-like serine protease [Granulosicoccus sp.]
MNSFFKFLGVIGCLVGATGLAIAQSDGNPVTEHTRIVGGEAKDIGFAPATVALLNNRLLAQTGSFYQSQFCGGTVIATRWVLTAAHCVSEPTRVTPASEISILMGTSNLNEPVNQPIAVRRVIPHQQYHSTSQANDIALLELEYDALAEPVAIDQQEIVLNEQALIVGWGALNTGNDEQRQVYPSELQGAVVNMIPGDECGGLYPRYFGLVDSRNLCAGVLNGGIDSCQGDSGGPLYRYNRNTDAAQSLVGITSWGFGCAEADAPGVYTQVSAFTGWITQQTGIGFPQPQPQQDDPQPLASPSFNLSTQSNTNNAPAANSQLIAKSAGANSFWIVSVLGLFAALRNACFGLFTARHRACQSDRMALLSLPDGVNIAVNSLADTTPSCSKCIYQPSDTRGFYVTQPTQRH